MSKLMVIGCGLSQIPTFESTKKLGVETIGIDGSDSCIAKDMPDIFENIDFNDLDKITKKAKDHKIDGIVVPGTDFPVIGAYVADQLGLSGVPVSVARTCSNKVSSRKKLQKNGFIVPKFIELNSYIPNLISHKIKESEMLYPLVVKPVDNMAARGVKIVGNEFETKAAVFEALKYSRTNTVIIEEFIEGMEFSIDSLVNNGEVYVFAFADRHFDLYPFPVEVGHTQPTILKQEMQDQVNDVFVKAVKALGITNGSAKGDVKLTSDGVVIIELAARISGGFLSGWTVPFTSNYYPHDDLIRIALNEPPEFPELNFEGFSAERVFLSIPGKIKEITRLQNTRCIKKIHFHKEVGDDVEYPYNNANRIGSAISYTKRGRDEAIYYAKEEVKNTIIRLEPNNEKTDSYLSTGYPAFSPGKREVDWEGRDIEFALSQIVDIIGINKYNNIKNDKDFWNAFYIGGVQGGVYYSDSK